MTAEEYKVICSQPDAFERGVIEASEQELLLTHPPSAVLLRAVLRTAPIPKPPLHCGDKVTDHFLVDINTVEAEQIVEYLVDSEAGAIDASGETTSEASRLGSLIDAWTNYIDFRDMPK